MLHRGRRQEGALRCLGMGKGAMGKGGEASRLPPLRHTPSDVHRDVYILVHSDRRPSNKHGSRPRLPPTALPRPPGGGSGAGRTTVARLAQYPARFSGAESCAPGRTARVAMRVPGTPKASLQVPPQSLARSFAESAAPPVTLRSYRSSKRPVAVAPLPPSPRDGRLPVARGHRRKEDEKRTGEQVDVQLASSVESSAIAAVVRELVKDEQTKGSTQAAVVAAGGTQEQEASPIGLATRRCPESADDGQARARGASVGFLPGQVRPRARTPVQQRQASTGGDECQRPQPQPP